MSHEIRTPLNAVMGLTDLVARTEMTPAQQEYLRKIKASSRTLLSVINDILDFSKIEAGRLSLEKTNFSLHETIANVAEMFAHSAYEKNLELIIHIDEETPAALVGDPVRLGQILINLVGNAIKFTKEGEIVLHVAPGIKPAASPTGISLDFCVSDTGIGIPEDRIPQLFKSFSQADASTTRKYGGTGLGLAICRKLTQLMGGDITVSSRPDIGSTFNFTIELERQPEKNQIAMIPPRDLRGLRVLIADDNHTALEILASAIRSFRMEAYTASSGKEAISLLEKQDTPFDLVLLDWKMPGLNGIETARHIKSNTSLERMPIICMVSAYGREDLIQYSEKRFLDTFLHKPVNPSLLFDTIMELFGRHDAMVGINPIKTVSSPELDHANLKGKKILLAEDNKINQEVALEWLHSAGIETMVADNGKEALAILDRHTFDGVLMDIQMPEMDGFEATQKIRQHPHLKDLPIIAMTAHALKGDRERCINAGMNDHVAKPIEPEILFATLTRWLNRNNADSALQLRTADTSNDTVPHKKNASSPEIPSPLKQEEEQPPLPLKLQGIDIQTGLLRVNHNRSLYLKLLNSFIQDFSHADDKILQYLKINDRSSAKRTAHSIKGVAANLGAERLSLKASELERILADPHEEIPPELREAFCLEMTRVINDINELSPTLAPPVPPEEKSSAHANAPQDLPTLISTLKTVGNLLDDDLDRARALLTSVCCRN